MLKMVIEKLKKLLGQQQLTMSVVDHLELELRAAAARDEKENIARLVTIVETIDKICTRRRMSPSPDTECTV